MSGLEQEFGSRQRAQNRNLFTMLNDAQVLALAAELNHLLWTDDAPKITADVEQAMRDDPGLEISTINMQCVAHAVVCAGLMLRGGQRVTTRSGSALVVFPEQGRNEKPHFVMKHWWLTTPSGLCDLSLNLAGVSKHKPVVFGNRNVADPNWKVSFKDDFRRAMEEAERCHTTKGCGVFYQTDNKMAVTLEDFEDDLRKKFSAAEKRGVPLRFIDIVEHCETILGGGPGLKTTPQSEAWQMLVR